jgi:hypothetical protein
MGLQKDLQMLRRRDRPNQVEAPAVQRKATLNAVCIASQPPARWLPCAVNPRGSVRTAAMLGNGPMTRQYPRRSPSHHRTQPAQEPICVAEPAPVAGRREQGCAVGRPRASSLLQPEMSLRSCAPRHSRAQSALQSENQSRTTGRTIQRAPPPSRKGPEYLPSSQVTTSSQFLQRAYSCRKPFHGR